MNRSHIDHIATESSRTPNNSRDTCNDDNCKEDSLTKKRDNTNQWGYCATHTQISRVFGLNGDLFFSSDSGTSGKNLIGKHVHLRAMWTMSRVMFDVWIWQVAT